MNETLVFFKIVTLTIQSTHSNMCSVGGNTSESHVRNEIKQFGRREKRGERRKIFFQKTGKKERQIKKLKRKKGNETKHYLKEIKRKGKKKLIPRKKERKKEQ